MFSGEEEEEEEEEEVTFGFTVSSRRSLEHLSTKFW